jgi:hypothetical protein
MYKYKPPFYRVHKCLASLLYIGGALNVVFYMYIMKYEHKVHISPVIVNFSKM